MPSERFRKKIVRHLDAMAGYHDYSHDKYIPPLKIPNGGVSQWGLDWSYSRSKCDFFGVEMITAGDAWFTQNGKKYLVKSGEAFLLRPGCSHIYQVGPSGYLHKRFLTIEGAALEPILRATQLWKCDHVRPDSPGRLIAWIKAAHRCLRKKENGFAMELSSLAYRILAELGQSITEPLPEPIRRTVEFMQRNLSLPLTCEAICSPSGLSLTHFNRLFKQHMQVSPLQFFLGQKMAWAKHLLNESSMSIKEIAEVIGFDSPLYFSSRFKVHCGTSPKSFRAKREADKTKN